MPVKVEDEDPPVKVPPEMVVAPVKVLVPVVELKVPVPDRAKVELAAMIPVEAPKVPAETLKAPVIFVVPPPVL